METQVDAGGNAAFRDKLRNVNVSGREYAFMLEEFVRGDWDAPDERLEEFFKAVEVGDRACADQVLREWGIR